jgi:hypothetical protein
MKKRARESVEDEYRYNPNDRRSKPQRQRLVAEDHPSDGGEIKV